MGRPGLVASRGQVASRALVAGRLELAVGITVLDSIRNSCMAQPKRGLLRLEYNQK